MYNYLYKFHLLKPASANSQVTLVTCSGPLKTWLFRKCGFPRENCVFKRKCAQNSSATSAALAVNLSLGRCLPGVFWACFQAVWLCFSMFFCNWFFKCLRNAIFRKNVAKWHRNEPQNDTKIDGKWVLKPSCKTCFRKSWIFVFVFPFLKRSMYKKHCKNEYETRFFTSAFRTQDLTKCVQKAKQNLCKIPSKWDPEGFQNRFRKKS